MLYHILKRVSVIIPFAWLFFQPTQVLAVCPEPAMADYMAYPIVQANVVEPNIMILLDNSSSMNERAYNEAYDHTKKYYGYFEPYRKYRYVGKTFKRDETNGDWDGNFLNWACMRRIDVVRKVLVGGKATTRDGSGTQVNEGEIPSGSDYVQWWGQRDVWRVTPNPNTLVYIQAFSGQFRYFYNDGSWHSGGDFSIRVQKGEDIDEDHLTDEDYNFMEGNLAGVLQALASRVRYGLEFFNYGTQLGGDPNLNGGTIAQVMGADISSLVDAIQTKPATTWTPLAEAFYTAVRYYQQEDPESELHYAKDASVIPNDSTSDDPYMNPDPVSCAKSFVILLTDGASTKDQFVPAFLRDFDNDGNDRVTVVDSGTTNDGVLAATGGSDTIKTFYLNYKNPYPSGTTPFNDRHIGKSLVLYDKNDQQIYSGEITGVTYYGGDTSGTSEIAVSGSTETASWKSGASPYNYGLSWKVVTSASTNESGGSAGSDYLDDIALYARTTDLRDDLEGDQNLILYTIYAFGGDVTARNLLRDASKNGGFVDRNGNNKPDLTSEWDEDNDGEPDTYFEASEGFLLESKLKQALNDILERAAAGSAVSLLSTSGEGEGTVVQAYYRPTFGSEETEETVMSAVTEVWAGYLQSVWVDSLGNLREDSDGDLALNEETDKVIVYFLDTVEGTAKIKKFTASEENPYPDVESDAYEVVQMDEINPLWEAGSLLAEKDADDRKIFTYVDKDEDGQVDEAINDPFDDLGEVVTFHTTTESGVSNVRAYLGVRDQDTWSYLGFTHRDRAANLIQYIRGKDTGFSGTTGMQIRSRTFNDNVWKLGDIVHSTPVSVSRPPDNFHLIYGDQSYEQYYNTFRDRETVVYVGANDGMLHAFSSWDYDPDNRAFNRPDAVPGDEQIGSEIWAYIPQSLLPHLKWLPSVNYGHVYYVDLRPKIFDAKILPDDTHYSDTDIDDNWGTILLCGLNLGGGDICVEDVFDEVSEVSTEIRNFSPSYFAIDITEPRKPRLLWEKSYQDLGFSASIPAVIKVKDKWFAVFGSGPTDYDGTSSQEARVFVVDLKTGDAYHDLTEFASGTTNGWLFKGTSGVTAFMNSPVSLDKGLNYNVDAVYLGETYWDNTDGSWKGKAHRIGIPWDWTDTSTYVDNPNDGSKPWTMNSFFDAPGPITASMTLSLDIFDNIWVYFGTGRYLSQDDKTDSEIQYLYGIVDPFFDSYDGLDPENDFHNDISTLELTQSDLFDADPYIVTTVGAVYDDGGYFGTWEELVSAARAEDGWVRTLTTPGERSVTKFTVVGGIVFSPTFIPNSDRCGFGGDSNLYGLYFETGTAFYRPIFEERRVVEDIFRKEGETVLGKITVGAGKSSALGIHVGQEEGAKAFIQQSTGTVLDAAIKPAFNLRSNLTNWREE
jgi:type IV pilus assembly protein PilY1